jgi:uncharacterized membrane protein YfcA
VLLLVASGIFILALLVGVIGNVAGIGGGVILVLFLIYLVHLGPLDASGLSLLTIVFSTLSGFIQDFRKKLVDKKLFVIISVLAVIGATVGSVMTHYVSSNTFKGAFSLITICIGMFSLYSTHKQTRKGIESYFESSDYAPNTGIFSLTAGVVSGFIGIGIGGIMGTFLTAIKRTKPRTAFATIIAAMLPVSIVGTGIHFYYTGFVNILYAPPLIAGALLGGVLGSWIISRSHQTNLRLFQGYIIIAFGVLSAILYLLTSYFH